MKIVGTAPEAIHLAEERGAFGKVLSDAGLPAPKHGMAVTFEDAKRIADDIGYPVLVRPSYVLGGRGMEIVYDDGRLRAYIDAATEISREHPVLVDRFIDDAVEIDVDALFDGHELFLGGVMEHIEEAGIHSGDSSCALPPITLGETEIDRIRHATEAIARGVGVRGLINIQFALSSDVLYVLEANPRASRTVPFVSKATATPLAKAAARVMLGETIADLRAVGLLPETDGGRLPADAPIAVKEAVMPFNRFKTIDGRNVDTVLGPEMKSTGEVMGFDADFGTAFAKAQAAAYGSLPTTGRIFVSVANRDKRNMIFPIKVLAERGFEILATKGTAEVLRRNGVSVTVVRKHHEGEGPGGREDHRPADPRRRHRPGHQHALLHRRLRPPRRLRDPDGGRARRHPLHHHRAGPRAPRCRASRRWPPARSASAACRTGSGGGPRADGSSLPPALRPRADPGRPGARAPRGVPGDPGGGAGDPTGAGRGGGAGRGDGAAVPAPVRARGGLRQERRRHRRPRGARLRPRRDRDRDRASRSPATRARACSACPQDRAVVNRMGFNNDGAEAVATRLARRGRPAGGPVLGINIGKTKVVPAEHAIADYEKSTGLLAPHADYLVVNVSSPNTPGLRDLQAVEVLEPLLTAVRRRADQVRPDDRVPLLVKIAPDLSDEDVLAVADLAVAIGLDGLIATNTTITREGLRTDPATVDGHRRRRPQRCPAARARDRGAADGPRAGRSRPHAGRRRRHQHRGRRARAPRRRGGPRPGLHRLRLRGRAVAAHGRRGARRRHDLRSPPAPRPCAARSTSSARCWRPSGPGPTAT